MTGCKEANCTYLHQHGPHGHGAQVRQVPRKVCARQPDQHGEHAHEEGAPRVAQGHLVGRAVFQQHLHELLVQELDVHILVLAASFWLGSCRCSCRSGGGQDQLAVTPSLPSGELQLLGPCLWLVFGGGGVVLDAVQGNPVRPAAACCNGHLVVDEGDGDEVPVHAVGHQVAVEKVCPAEVLDVCLSQGREVREELGRLVEVEQPACRRADELDGAARVVQHQLAVEEGGILHAQKHCQAQ